jgi:nucleoside recognition membrane protein YjiH
VDQLGVAVFTSLTLVLTIALAVMGLVFLILGKWLEIWDDYYENSRPNHALRDDYIAAVIVTAVAWGTLVAGAGLSVLLDALTH